MPRQIVIPEDKQLSMDQLVQFQDYLELIQGLSFSTATQYVRAAKTTVPRMEEGEQPLATVRRLKLRAPYYLTALRHWQDFAAGGAQPAHQRLADAPWLKGVQEALESDPGTSAATGVRYWRVVRHMVDATDGAVFSPPAVIEAYASMPVYLKTSALPAWQRFGEILRGRDIETELPPLELPPALDDAEVQTALAFLVLIARWDPQLLASIKWQQLEALDGREVEREARGVPQPSHLASWMVVRGPHERVTFRGPAFWALEVLGCWAWPDKAPRDRTGPIVPQRPREFIPMSAKAIQRVAEEAVTADGGAAAQAFPLTWRDAWRASLPEGAAQEVEAAEAAFVNVTPPLVDVSDDDS